MPYMHHASRLTVFNPLMPRPLSPREMQVARLIAQGKVNKEIAIEMGVTVGSVKTRVSTILDKLILSNRTEIALWVVNGDKESQKAS